LELQLVDWQHTDCHVTNLVGCITYDKRLIHMIQQTQLQCYEPHWVYNLSQTSHLYDRAANCRVTNRVECITYDMWLIYTIQQIQVQRHEPRWVYEISDMTHSYDTADQLPRHEPRWVYSKRRIHAVVQTNGRVTNRAECRKYQIWLIHPIRQTTAASRTALSVQRINWVHDKWRIRIVVQTNCRITNHSRCKSIHMTHSCESVWHMTHWYRSVIDVTVYNIWRIGIVAQTNSLVQTYTYSCSCHDTIHSRCISEHMTHSCDTADQLPRHEPRWLYDVSSYMTYSYDTAQADQLPRHELQWVCHLCVS